MSLDEDDVAKIADLVSAEMTHQKELEDAARHERVAKRQSAKRLRRIILVFVVLGACATTHFLIEAHEVAWLAQSVELILAAFFEGLFGTVRE